MSQERNNEITTGRLSMRPLEPADIEAFADGRDSLARHLGRALPQGWPWRETEEMLPWIKAQMEKEPGLLGWLAWLIFERESGDLIGDAGFGGKPNDEGFVSLGYSIAPDFRQKGYATEAARALVEWALKQPGVKGVRAETMRDGEASIRVLEKIQFRKVDQTEEVLRWELKAEDYVPDAARR